MKCSDAGIALIKEFEGYRSSTYDDVGGKPTIGFGHLVRADESFTAISEGQATALLCADLQTAEACIEDCVDVPLSQNQFDALTAFVFNVGAGRPGKFGRDGFRYLKSGQPSHMLRYINAGDFAAAAQEFPKWDHVSGMEERGLLKRRLAEQLLFEKV